MKETLRNNWIFRHAKYIKFDWRLLGSYQNRGWERIGKTILLTCGRKVCCFPKRFRTLLYSIAAINGVSREIFMYPSLRQREIAMRPIFPSRGFGGFCLHQIRHGLKLRYWLALPAMWRRDQEFRRELTETVNDRDIVAAKRIRDSINEAVYQEICREFRAMDCQIPTPREKPH